MKSTVVITIEDEERAYSSVLLLVPDPAARPSPGDVQMAALSHAVRQAARMRGLMEIGAPHVPRRGKRKHVAAAATPAA